MKPSRELDALVAEKVMGGLTNIKPCSLADGPPHYSTDIAAAWEVVEKIQSSEFSLSSGYCTSDQAKTNLRIDIHKERNGYELQFMDRKGHTYCAAYDCPTLPHAICLAALKAVGFDLK